MVLGFFCAAGTAGALVDKTGFMFPVGPGVSCGRGLDDDDVAASAAAFGLIARSCTAWGLDRTVLHIMTRCRDRFLFTFSAGAGIGFNEIRCAGNLGFFVFLYPDMYMRCSLNRDIRCCLLLLCGLRLLCLLGFLLG